MSHKKGSAPGHHKPSSFARMLERLENQPSRTWSVIITFYGDALLPRGKSLWLGTLLAFFKEMGTSDGVVRTAMSRLATDGWLERNKVGRNSFYRLADRGRATFEAASGRIYASPTSAGDAGLKMVFLSAREDRERVQVELREAGFGNPAPGVWIAKEDVPNPNSICDEVQVSVMGDNGHLAELVERAWPIRELDAHYVEFIDTFRPLLHALREGYRPRDGEAIVARVLMVHEFRRIVLKDPGLSSDMLPPNWTGHAARALASALYHELAAPSERWLDANAIDENGRLDRPALNISSRFSS